MNLYIYIIPMSSYLKDGLELLKLKEKKIEGYTDIMTVNDSPPPPPDYTADMYDNLQNNISSYTTTYKALSDKTNDYFGLGASGASGHYSGNGNYNMYVVTPMDKGQINATPYTGGMCILGSPAALGLTPSTDFDALYPANFPNTATGIQNAIESCKLVAADTQLKGFQGTNYPGTSYFAVTKDTTTNKLKCFTGSNISSVASATIKQKYNKKIAYKVQTSTDATRGGLFYDGTVGVYSSRMTMNVNGSDMPITGIKQDAENIYYLASDSDAIEGILKVNIKDPTQTESRYQSFRTMGGRWINGPTANGTVYPRAPVQAVNKKTDGTKVYMFYDNVYTKMVTVSGEARYFAGNIIGAFDPTKWDQPVYANPTASANGGYNVSTTAVDMSNPVLTDFKISDWSTYTLVPSTMSPTRIRTGGFTLNFTPTMTGSNANAKTTETLSVYTKCNKFFGGGINSISATLGKNCRNPGISIIMLVLQTSQTVADSFIQISQMAVYGYNAQGERVNVASRLINPNANAWGGRGGYGHGSGTDHAIGGWETSPLTPIDGTLSIRDGQGIYHSPTANKDEWWTLGLGSEYVVDTVVFYGRSNCCHYRNNGMKIWFGNSTKGVSVKNRDTGQTVDGLVLNSDSVQTFNIGDPNA